MLILRLSMLATLATGAHAAEPKVDLTASGVIAHAVISQIEIAKNNSANLGSHIDLIKMRALVLNETNRLNKLRNEIEAKINEAEKSNKSFDKRNYDLHFMIGSLSQAFYDASEVVRLVDSSNQKDLLAPEMKLLSEQITTAKATRESINERLGMLSIKSKNETEKAKAEQLALLNAKEHELDKMVSDKLILGSITHNSFYVTGESIPQEDDKKLISRVIKSALKNGEIYIEITGRADPRGSKKYNEKLASDRANRIKEIAISAGANEEDIKTSSYVADVSIKKNREMHFFDRHSTVSIMKKKDSEK